MTLVRPKPFLDRLRHRKHAQGVERRRNMSKMILEKSTPFPLPVDYEDIDSAFFEWVEKKLEITYDGKKLPTYKLFSNQKLSEYSQTWSNLDENNNIIMNFKTITRENNPQHGESQGNMYNVPGERDYAMFYVPVLQENGEEAYDMYTMKQPLSVNFMYTVSLVCNKYELLNEMNSLIQREFSALECYIWPNKHPMPMVIENISDESAYSIDDRKYYAQSYQIKLMGYVIRKDGFKVTKIPSRFKMTLLGSEEKVKKTNKHDTWLGKASDEVLPPPIAPDDDIAISDRLPAVETDKVIDECGNITHIPTDRVKPGVSVEEDYEIPECCLDKENPFYYKTIKLIVEFPICDERKVKFKIDTYFEVDMINTTNIHDFKIKINGETVDLDDELTFNVGDEVEIIITREDEYKDAQIVIIGQDPNTVFDSRIDYESALDEPSDYEEIIVKRKEEESIDN